MIDLMFLAHNRLEFTHASMDTLLENTDWQQVHCAYILDDMSEDGTFEYLDEVARDFPTSSVLVRDSFGGPVAAMNRVLSSCEGDILAKVDNDLIVPPGWLDDMVKVMDNNPPLDALGLEPGFAAPFGTNAAAYGYKPASHIGGQGLFRTRVFASRRPKANQRWFGLTHFQRRYMRTGWINPDLPAFNLDHLPEEPWSLLANLYVQKGWSRAWPPYSPAMKPYWSWYTSSKNGDISAARISRRDH